MKKKKTAAKVTKKPNPKKYRTWAAYSEVLRRQVLLEKVKKLHLEQLQKNIENGLIGKNEAAWIESHLPKTDYFSKAEKRKRKKIQYSETDTYALYFGIKIGMMMAKAKLDS